MSIHQSTANSGESSFIAAPPTVVFSFINNEFDTKPRCHSLEWDMLTGWFSRAPIRAKKSASAFIPATFGTVPNDKGSLRHKGNVLSIHAVVLDLDGKAKQYQAHELEKALAGFQFLAYTTHSATRENPRWRVVLPLENPIHPSQLEPAFAELEALTGLATDPQATDPARLFFTPGVPAERANEYQFVQGEGQRFQPGRATSQKTKASPKKQRVPSNGTPLQKPVSKKSKDREPRETYYSRFTGNEPDLKSLSAAMHTPEICAQVAASMGLNTGGLLENRRVSGIRSPLPGHEDKKPSGGLILTDDGAVLFKDFSGHFNRELYDLPTLRATIAYGYPVALRAPEWVIWTLRLLNEAGLIQPAPVDIPPPFDGASESERRVYEGFKLLIGLKRVSNHGYQEIAFSKRFAAAWCNVSEASAHRAKTKLMDAGIISLVGQHKGRRTCDVFLPGKVRVQKRRKPKPFLWGKVLNAPTATPAEKIKAACACILKTEGHNVTLKRLSELTGLTDEQIKEHGEPWQWGDYS